MWIAYILGAIHSSNVYVDFAWDVDDRKSWDNYIMFFNGGPIFLDKLQITMPFHFDGVSMIHFVVLLVKETILAY